MAHLQRVYTVVAGMMIYGRLFGFFDINSNTIYGLYPSNPF